MLAFFHNFMMVLGQLFFLFRMLDWHLMLLISWKKPSLCYKYVYPHISQWTKFLKNITDRYFNIHRFVLNKCMPLIWKIKNERVSNFDNYCTSQLYQYNTTVYVFFLNLHCTRCSSKISFDMEKLHTVLLYTQILKKW